MGKKSAIKTKHYTDFDKMMADLGGLTYKEAKKLNLRDQELMAMLQTELEDDGVYAHIFACYTNDPLVKAFAEEHDLQIITYSFGEDEESGNTVCLYATGMHYVDRERYYFCRSKEDATCEETF